MGIYDELRRAAKTDSRRFGKSVICRIVYGPLLSFIESKGLVPTGIYINNQSGLDPINNKMFVIPVSKYDEIKKTYLNFDTMRPPEEGVDLEYYEAVARSNDYLIKLIQQNLIMVTMNHTKPNDANAGTSPDVYDVMIDGTDVNQAVEGSYVYRNSNETIREQQKWNR